MLFTFNSTLNSCIVYFTNFFRIKSGPFLIVKTFVEILNILQINKINKSITNITVIEKINWQIEEIKLILKFSIKSIYHLFFSIFVRNVSNHESCPVLLNNFVWNDFKSIIVFCFLVISVDYILFLLLLWIFSFGIRI